MLRALPTESKQSHVASKDVFHAMRHYTESLLSAMKAKHNMINRVMDLLEKALCGVHKGKGSTLLKSFHLCNTKLITTLVMYKINGQHHLQAYLTTHLHYSAQFEDHISSEHWNLKPLQRLD